MPVYTKNGVYAYISTPADTTCAVAGDWYRLEGVFTNEILKGFSIPVDKIVYNGVSCCFQIVVLGSFQSDTAGNNIVLGLFKNGLLQANSQMLVYLKYAHEPANIGLCDVIPFLPTEDLEIRVKSDKAGSLVRAVTLTTSASEF